MKYVTFHARDDAWLLFDGVGTGGTLLGQRPNPPPLIDFSAGPEPVLWACSSWDDPMKSVIERVRLPELAAEQVISLDERLSAIATSSDGRQIAVIQIPMVSGESCSLGLWSGEAWRQVESEVRPDVSSRLAWIDSRRIAFESTLRRISVLDTETEEVQTGPAGCCPASATDAGKWYILRGGRVVALDAGQEIDWGGKSVEWLDARTVTSLRVTRDGEAFTWTEPRFWFGSKTVIQKRGQRRIGGNKLKMGLWVVLGPYDL